VPSIIDGQALKEPDLSHRNLPESIVDDTSLELIGIHYAAPFPPAEELVLVSKLAKNDREPNIARNLNLISPSL